MKWNLVIVLALFLAVSLTAMFFPPLTARGADSDYWQDTDNYRLVKTGQVQGSLGKNDDKKVLAYLKKGLRLLKAYGGNPSYRIKFIARLSIQEKLTYPRWRVGNDKRMGTYLSKFTKKLWRLIMQDKIFTFSGASRNRFIHQPADFDQKELEDLIADIENGWIDFASLRATQKTDIVYTADIAREPNGYKGGSCGPPRDQETYDKWVSGEEIPKDEKGNGCPLDEDRVKHTDWLVKRDGPRTTKKKIVHEQGGKIFAKVGGAGHHNWLEGTFGATIIQAKGRAAFVIYDKRNGYQVNSRVLDYFDPAKVEQVVYNPENVVSGPIYGSHYLERNREPDACFRSHAIFKQKWINQTAWNKIRQILNIDVIPYDPALLETVAPHTSVEVELAKGEVKDTACGGAPGEDSSSSSETKPSNIQAPAPEGGRDSRFQNFEIGKNGKGSGDSSSRGSKKEIYLKGENNQENGLPGSAGSRQTPFFPRQGPDNFNDRTDNPSDSNTGGQNSLPNMDGGIIDRFLKAFLGAGAVGLFKQ